MSEVKCSHTPSSAEPVAEGKVTSVVRQMDTDQRRPSSTTTSSSVRGKRAALQLQRLEEERAIQLEKIKLEEEYVREKFRIMETQCGEEDESASLRNIAAKRVDSWLTQSNASSTPEEGDVTREIWRMRAGLGNQKPATEEEARTVKTPWTLTKEQKAARQALPKDLPEFNGDPAEWPTFISNFQFSTKACGYQDGENMIRLQRCLKGAAKEAVRGRLLLPESVPSVINALKRRFGRPELLLEIMIDRVRKTPAPRADDLEGLIEFGEMTQSLCEHVRSAGMVEHTTNPMLISELIQKLPTDYRMRWARWIRGRSCGSLETLADFMEQITNDAISITRLPGNGSYRAKEDGARQSPRINTKATFTSSKARVREQCAICSETHRTFRCENLISMAVQQRREVATQKKLCWNCLCVRHQVKSCNSKHVCRVCAQKHHTLLHEPTQEGASASLSARVCANTVVLETATVWVIDRYGNRHHARALLDSASMCNFISRKMAERLQLRWTKTDTNIVGIAESCHQVKFEIRATIQSKLNSFNSSQNFLIMTKPTSDLPTSMININDIKLPDVQLADSKFNIPAPIDMILGAEIYQSLFTGKRIELDSGNPTLVETVFGWIIGGPVREELPTKSLACHLTLVGLENALQRFWQLDAVPEMPQQPDNQCEEFYASTTIRDNTGRYAVRLPQTHDPTKQLGESRSIALRRFQVLERRLNSDNDLKHAYHEFMNEYERLGHMKKIENSDNNMVHCFLPHHAVFKASSTTTKTRVVFDASCKTASGYSLNDILLVGPVVQRDLLTLLMQFRFHAIALVGDIEKMYRQIGVQPVDQPLQRILWRKTPEEAISTYQLQTVTYGTSSAPYLATRTLQKVAQDMSHMSPKAADVISKDFYVDDLLSGSTDASAAIQLRKEISEILASAGMSMKKWASNSIEVLNSIPLEDRAIEPWHNFQDNQTVSTLGLTWEPQSDVLSFKVQPPDKVKNYTKRIVLSQIAKIFDPLGLAGPVITRAKIFMQYLWTAKSIQGKPFNWDEPLDTQMQSQWREFYETIGTLNQLRIPRFITLTSPIQLELHLFADASEKAYGACCYVRTESSHQSVVHLLTSKSKVAPIATRHTIARLELCAALLASTLYQQIKASIEVPYKVYFWSDSTTTLHWIRSTPARWNIFVANRVSQIQQIHSADAWNYVPGKENPADDISRGLSATEFLDNERWWSGPTWLRSTKELWPDQPIHDTNSPEALQELKKSTLRCMKVVQSEFVTDLFMRYSSYSKLRRLMDYWARYLKRLRSRLKQHNNDLLIAKGTVDPITTEELHAAEHSLCRMAQRESFYEEHTELLRGKHVSRSSRLKWLNPQLDQKGLIRVGGRLNYAKISEDARHPIVLCSKHPLARMIAEYYHRKLLHAGPQLMLSTIHLKFWMLSGRNLVRTVYHQCHICFHHRPSLIQQSMADLPSSRVIPSRPFLTCGVDYFGPVFIKSEIRNRSASKAYVAIFICFVTRAVHIELVSDLSTNAFLATLHRFVARRGKPNAIYSDNATCFKGAANQLHKVYRMLQKASSERDKIINWCTDNEIQWHFIPPRAPQFGGLWEAAVKSAKHHFLREIGNSNISREDMITLLAQIEMCLNSRPLVHMPSETTDLEVLTPGHFLIGGNLQAISEVPLQEIPENRLSHWERTQQRTQRFWTRWRKEYLQQLQTRATKGCNPPVSIDVGRVVLLKEDNAPPATWPLARITATHPGKDGVVRVITLKTANADNVVRPVSKIALLPCSM